MDNFMQFLRKDKTYIVGVSGGCDSMALLDMLYQQGYRVIACHVNYHLRHDSDLDQANVEEYCQARQIACHVKEVLQDEYHSENFQSQARNIRYQFYYKTAIQYQTDSVVLAHHKDDVLENIVMQLQRKNTKGYWGIKTISHVCKLTVIRPCLAFNKQYLRDYCHEHHVVYRDDYTNFQTDFTRDYVRNVTLKNYDDEKIAALFSSAKKHNEEYLEKKTMIKQYLEVYHRDNKIDFQVIPEDLKEIFIYEMIKEFVYPPLISDNLIKEIIKQASSTKPNIEMDLPVNIRFIKEYNNIRVSNFNNSKGYCLKYENLVYDKSEYFCLAPEGDLNAGVCLTTEDFPITVRTVRQGDVIVTSGGTKRISRLFINNKIPKSQREIWPIVVNCQGTIVLVPYLAKNIKYLYSKPNLYVVKL